MPRDLEPDEQSIYRSFATLRRRLEDVGHAFEEQLRERLDEADQPHVGLGGTLGAALTQLLNLVTGLFGPDESPSHFAAEPPEDSHDAS